MHKKSEVVYAHYEMFFSIIIYDASGIGFHLFFDFFFSLLLFEDI